MTFSVVVNVAACEDVSVIGLADVAEEVDVTVCDEVSVFGSADVTGTDVTISDEVSVTVSVAGVSVTVSVAGVLVTVSVAFEVVDCSAIVTPLSENYIYISTNKVIIHC